MKISYKLHINFILANFNNRLNKKRADGENPPNQLLAVCAFSNN